VPVGWLFTIIELYTVIGIGVRGGWIKKLSINIYSSPIVGTRLVLNFGFF